MPIGELCKPPSSVRKYRPSEPQSPVEGHHNAGHKERHRRWTIKRAPCLENHRQNDSSRRSFSICPTKQIICFYILDGPPPLPLLLSSQPIIQLFAGHFLNTDQYRLVRWNGPILSASPTPTTLDIFFAPCGRPRIPGLSCSQHFVIARPRFDVILAVSVTTFIHQAQVPWKDPTPSHHCATSTFLRCIVYSYVAWSLIYCTGNRLYSVQCGRIWSGRLIECGAHNWTCSRTWPLGSCCLEWVLWTGGVKSCPVRSHNTRQRVYNRVIETIHKLNSCHSRSVGFGSLLASLSSCLWQWPLVGE